jgi:AcrR family transcriptional regulator
VGIKERRERERQATRQAILQAALDIAAEEGWPAVTIRHIAERIEYSPAAIYKYFDEKEAILQTLVAEGFLRLHQTLEGAADAIVDGSGPTPADLPLLRLVAAYWDFAQHNATLYQLMFSLQGKLTESREAKAVFTLVRTALQDWSRSQAVALRDLNAAVDLLWAALHGLVALAMAHVIYGGNDRVRQLLLQMVHALLLAWKSEGQP